MSLAPYWPTLSLYLAATLVALPVVAISAYGYGFAVIRVLAFPTSIAMTVGIGISALVFVGGLLNLAGAVSKTTIWILLTGGCAFSLAFVIWQRPRWTLPRSGLGRAQILLFLSIAICAGLILFGHSFYPDLNRYDDLPAYLAFPQKMLEAGQLGAEPFSERRLTTSLGGLYFLHTIALALTDRWHLHMIDPVLGSLLLMALVYELARSGAGTPERGMVAALFSALLVPNIANLSVTTLSAALLCVLYRTVDKADEMTWTPGRAVVIGLVAAAAFGLKSNLLPFVAAFLAAFYLIIFARRPSFRVVAEAGMAATATIVFALPWMIAQFLDTGTPLFPILGKGGHGSQYGYYFDFGTARTVGDLVDIFVREFLLTGPFLAALGGSVLVIAGARRKGPVPSNLLALLPAVIAGGVALTVGTGGEGVIRYAYSGVVAFAVLAVAESLSATGGPMRLRVSDVVLALVLILAVGIHREYIVKYVAYAVRNVGIAVFGPQLRPQMLYARIETSGVISSMRDMQNAVPAGAVLMERLDYPFLLDFRRNPILINDWPGGASPLPGLPLFQGPEPVAAYLLQRGVRYVAYAWRSEALFPESERHLLLDSPWINASANAAFDFQRSLVALMASRQLLYRDDERVVIDLAERAVGE